MNIINIVTYSNITLPNAVVLTDYIKLYDQLVTINLDQSMTSENTAVVIHGNEDLGVFRLVASWYIISLLEKLRPSIVFKSRCFEYTPKVIPVYDLGSVIGTNSKTIERWGYSGEIVALTGNKINKREFQSEEEIKNLPTSIIIRELDGLNAVNEHTPYT